MHYCSIKRLIDLSASFLALLFLLPLLAIIALLIRLESNGNPLFFQERIGENGKPFRIVKFRSMVKDAPKLGSWQTQENDPRITRLGNFLRRTSIDELPQLWNVLTGDMSLIGPRPQTPAQITLYNPADWHGRHLVRPGITGLAQVNGRSAITLEEQIKYDLQYVMHLTPAMDMRIFLATLNQVLRKTGAN